MGDVFLLCLDFFDNVAEPSICEFIGADDFPQIPIESGNVLVRR
jgi:hypothetical protein